MKVYLLCLLAFTVISKECEVSEAVTEFAKKEAVNPYPHFEEDPYKDTSEEFRRHVQEVINSDDLMCAIKYTDASKTRYTVQQFKNEAEVAKAGFTITHQGPCGACSTLKDLSVYLGKDLTRPVRRCGLLYSSISRKWTMNCLQNLGFTEQCAEIWYFNILNTKKHCFWVCMWSYIIGEPLNRPDGTLNTCIQCDEDQSGPFFKYFSGRTRRNSGIESEIRREDREIYEMEQCYY